MTIRITLACCSALALAACSGSGQPSASETAAAPGGVIADATPPTVLASASASGTADAASASSSTAPTDGTPFAMRGRWGLVAADCAPGRADAKGLMTIASSSIKFYESIAELSKTSDRSETMLRGSYNFSGEGVNWKRDITLTLAPDGKTLVKLESGQDAPPGPMKYTHCS